MTLLLATFDTGYRLQAVTHFGKRKSAFPSVLLEQFDGPMLKCPKLDFVVLRDEAMAEKRDSARLSE